MSERPRHPSGKPVRERRIVARPIWRVPDKGAVTPRLRDDDRPVSAIGFTARICSDDDVE